LAPDLAEEEATAKGLGALEKVSGAVAGEAKALVEGPKGFAGPKGSEGVKGPDGLKGPKDPKGASSGKAPKLSKKNRRILHKFGLGPSALDGLKSHRKLLNYRMLFSEPPIHVQADEEVAKNIRLLFMAYADHRMPSQYDKFVAFLKNNMCGGISDSQLDRLLGILKDNGFVNLDKTGKVLMNIGNDPSCLPMKAKRKGKVKD
jgi:hypothetical protein